MKAFKDFINESINIQEAVLQTLECTAKEYILNFDKPLAFGKPFKPLPNVMPRKPDDDVIFRVITQRVAAGLQECYKKFFEFNNIIPDGHLAEGRNEYVFFIIVPCTDAILRFEFTTWAAPEYDSFDITLNSIDTIKTATTKTHDYIDRFYVDGVKFSQPVGHIDRNTSAMLPLWKMIKAYVEQHAEEIISKLSL